jgi:hypothetical protein
MYAVRPHKPRWTSRVRYRMPPTCREHALMSATDADEPHRRRGGDQSRTLTATAGSQESKGTGSGRLVGSVRNAPERTTEPRTSTTIQPAGIGIRRVPGEPAGGGSQTTFETSYVKTVVAARRSPKECVLTAGDADRAAGIAAGARSRGGRIGTGVSARARRAAARRARRGRSGKGCDRGVEPWERGRRLVTCSTGARARASRNPVSRSGMALHAAYPRRSPVFPSHVGAVTGPWTIAAVGSRSQCGIP